MNLEVGDDAQHVLPAWVYSGGWSRLLGVALSVTTTSRGDTSGTKSGRPTFRRGVERNVTAGAYLKNHNAEPSPPTRNP